MKPQIEHSPSSSSPSSSSFIIIIAAFLHTVWSLRTSDLISASLSCKTRSPAQLKMKSSDLTWYQSPSLCFCVCVCRTWCVLSGRRCWCSVCVSDLNIPALKLNNESDWRRLWEHDIISTPLYGALTAMSSCVCVCVCVCVWEQISARKNCLHEGYRERVWLMCVCNVSNICSLYVSALEGSVCVCVCVCVCVWDEKPSLDYNISFWFSSLEVINSPNGRKMH